MFSSERGSKIVWALGIVAALGTAFYMFRLVYLTFLGNSRVTAEKQHHLHESPRSMTVPLMILAVLSIVGGWIGLPQLLTGGSIPNFFHEWLAPVVTQYGETHVHHYSHTVEFGLMGLSVLVATAGWWFARSKYRELKTRLPEPTTYTGLYKMLWNKYWMDEIYARLITKPLLMISEKLFLNKFDKGTIDGLANGSARGWQRLAGWGSRLQTGNIQAYGFYILIGTALVIGLSLLY